MVQLFNWFKNLRNPSLFHKIVAMIFVPTLFALYGSFHKVWEKNQVILELNEFQGYLDTSEEFLKLNDVISQEAAFTSASLIVDEDSENLAYQNFIRDGSDFSVFSQLQHGIELEKEIEGSRKLYEEGDLDATNKLFHLVNLFLKKIVRDSAEYPSYQGDILAVVGLNLSKRYFNHFKAKIEPVIKLDLPTEKKEVEEIISLFEYSKSLFFSASMRLYPEAEEVRQKVIEAESIQSIEKVFKKFRALAEEGDFVMLLPAMSSSNKQYLQQIDETISAQLSSIKNNSDSLLENARKELIWATLFAILNILIISSLFILFYRSTNQTIENLFQSLEDLTRKLNNYVQSLDQSSENLSISSKSAHSSAIEAKSSLDQINTEIEKSSGQLKVTSDGSNEVSSLITKNSQELEKLQLSMNSIEKMKDNLYNIVSKIKDVSDKIEVIHDFVFQTKLLSFNASIEAARAGEHGRGFSVVAEEVANLSINIGITAVEIDKMLNKNLAEIEQVADEDSKKITTSIESTVSVKAAFDSVESEIKNIQSGILSIKSASDHQADEVAKIVEQMKILDASTEDNLNSAEKSVEIANLLKTSITQLNQNSSQLFDFFHGKNKSSKL